MTRRLVLVRHGQILATHAGRLVGTIDPPLDVCGHAQAKALPGRLDRWKPQRCYCSPLVRCRQTAQAAVPSLSLILDDRLREVGFGRWENCTFEEVARAEPALVDRWGAFADDFAFPGGEGLRMFLDRVRAVADEMAHDTAETVLAITHGGVIRAMLCHLLGLEPRKYVAFAVSYAGIAVVELYDGRGVLSVLEPAATEEIGHG